MSPTGSIADYRNTDYESHFNVSLPLLEAMGGVDVVNESASEINSAAVNAMRHDDWKAAFELFLVCAMEKLDPFAQTMVGQMYRDGRGVPLDESMGFFWINLASEQGFAQATFELSKLYMEGRGVQLDERRAVDLLLKAADKGDQNAVAVLMHAVDSGIITALAAPVAIDTHGVADER